MTPEKAKHLNAQTECSALKTDQHSKKFRTNKAPESNKINFDCGGQICSEHLAYLSEGKRVKTNIQPI